LWFLVVGLCGGVFPPLSRILDLLNRSPSVWFIPPIPPDKFFAFLALPDISLVSVFSADHGSWKALPFALSLSSDEHASIRIPTRVIRSLWFLQPSDRSRLGSHFCDCSPPLSLSLRVLALGFLASLSAATSIPLGRSLVLCPILALLKLFFFTSVALPFS